MSKVDSLYKDYVQKSRIFLYPALNIKRGHSVTPIQTYTAWNGVSEFKDQKLVCTYHMRTDHEFKDFEKTKLLGNSLFHDFKVTDDGLGVYVFDLSSIKNDWNYFLEGRYSKLSPDLKKKVQDFFGTSNRGYIDSFLYPDRFYKIYAELLTTKREDESPMLKLLKEVGELCSKPNLELENLRANIKDLDISQRLS